MARFLVRRVIQALIVLLVLSIAIYGLIGLMPGDPLDMLLANSPGATPEAIAHLRHIYGLDQPLPVRYWHWLLAALQGHFGTSRLYQQPVLQVLAPALGRTCLLMLSSFVLSVALSFALGIAASRKPGGWADAFVSFGSLAGISVPVFWLALVLILVFAVSLHWLPASGSGGGPLWIHLVLPVITLTLATTGQFTRYVRASLIESLRMDHVRTARAKGAGEGRLTLVHALRPALIPVVTIMALSFGTLFSGALITEVMFGIQGMGKVIYDAIQGNDFNLALTALLFAAIVTLLSTLAADLLYAWLDPRVTLQ